MGNKELVHDRETALEMLHAALTDHAQPSLQATPGLAPGGSAERQRNAPVQPGEGHRRRCRCGVCRTCLDNARWDRVYNEKFADLDYYSGLRLSHRSPLAGF